MNYYVYIISNDYNNVIYIGITNNINRRLYEHKSGFLDGFTKKYNVHKLVYLETYNEAITAIAREKQLKRWSRTKKNKLIESLNPDWKDLTSE